MGSNRSSRVYLYAALAAASAGVLGCPGRLEDKWRFIDGGSDGGSDAGSLGPCPGDFDVPVDLFQMTCGRAGCHSATNPAGSLDLVSAGVGARLIGRPSNTCSGYILVTGADSGFLFDKLGGSPACGFAMPYGAPPISGAEMSCLVDWVNQQIDAGLVP
jgi:hypothetical protein